MSGRKNYNSIVFLTTLGVYLGLVLAGGAAPSVLAQAATTRDFDIKNEVVLEDDLDKKPDDQELDGFFETGLDQAVASFIEDLRRLKREGKYRAGFRKTFSAACSHVACSADEALASISVEHSDDELADVVEALRDRLDLANRKGFDHLAFVETPRDSKGCKQIALDVHFSAKALQIDFRFSKETVRKAFLYSEALNRRFAEKANAAANSLVRNTYAGTRAVPENDQVFIVTRLPRGSIDELLARK